jgi:5-methylcytosine-specific restriction endonuclease McrA
MMNIHTKILTLDMAGVPRKWEDVEKVVEYYAKDKIAWDLGDFEYTMRGGIQRVSGIQSEITVKSIVAVKGTEHLVGKERTPPLSRRMLFSRDRCVCAYCGQKYDERHLEQEHVVPRAQGGRSTWTNLVTACYHCNDLKGNRTPEQAQMPLVYLPYIPNRYEELLLSNRHILADQMELLMSKAKHFKMMPRGGLHVSQ